MNQAEQSSHAQAIWQTDALGPRGDGFAVLARLHWTDRNGMAWRGLGQGTASRRSRDGAAGCGAPASLPGRSYATGFRLRSAEGGWRWTSVLAAPVRHADGSVRKWVGMNIDIDAEKYAEDALRESETRFRALATVECFFAPPHQRRLACDTPVRRVRTSRR